MKQEPYTKLNSKWIKGLNVRPETIKHLGERIARTFSDVSHINILYDPPPKVMEIKINKFDLIKVFAPRRKYKQGEKTALRMGDNISKQNN